MLSCACVGDSPTHELEFDITPTITRGSRLVQIEVSEIKASRSLASEACQQLMQRLRILEGAIRATQSLSEQTTVEDEPSIIKRGYVLIPSYSRKTFTDYTPPQYNITDFDLVIKYV